MWEHKFIFFFIIVCGSLGCLVVFLNAVTSSQT